MSGRKGPHPPALPPESRHFPGKGANFRHIAVRTPIVFRRSMQPHSLSRPIQRFPFSTMFPNWVLFPAGSVMLHPDLPNMPQPLCSAANQSETGDSALAQADLDLAFFRNNFPPTGRGHSRIRKQITGNGN